MELDLSKIMPNMPTDADELATVQKKHQQIIAENVAKEKQRRARNHRLCEHGAIMEELFPQTITMNREQFIEFMRELAYGTQDASRV